MRNANGTACVPQPGQPLPPVCFPQPGERLPRVCWDPRPWEPRLPQWIEPIYVPLRHGEQQIWC